MVNLTLVEQALMRSFCLKEQDIASIIKTAQNHHQASYNTFYDAYEKLLEKNILTFKANKTVVLNKHINEYASPCSTCNFELYNVIALLPNSTLGLYDDNRFPGRSILTLNKHYSHLEDIPDNELLMFMQEIKQAVASIKRTTKVDRVNIAILGNAVSHVHAHLIPRYPEQETFPNKSPWNDERELQPLNLLDKERLMDQIFFNITQN